MTNARLNTGFTHYAEPQLLAKGEQVLEAMTGNKNFSSPEPDIATLTAAVKDYEEKLGKAKSGLHSDVLAKDGSRATLAKTLSELAFWCNRQSEDGSILATTGMELSKEKAKIGALGKPENFKVAPGPNKGSVKLSVKAVPHAAFYEFQCTPAPATAESVWKTYTSKKKTIIIEGLTSGNEYVFRASAAGSDPSRVWTDEISTFII